MAGGGLLLLAVIMGAQGAVKVATGVELWSDNVLIAVMSSVQIGALAPFLEVIRGLFPTSATRKQGRKKR
jgi:hypothetical protein